MYTNKKEATGLSEARLNQIVDQIANNIYESELKRGPERYGRDAINSHCFVYDVMMDCVDEIAVQYGISDEEANHVFYKAWYKAYDRLEPNHSTK